MSPPRRSLRRSILLVALVALCLFATAVRAQDDDAENDNDNTPATANQPPAPTTNNSPAATTANNSNDNDDEDGSTDNSNTDDNNDDNTDDNNSDDSNNDSNDANTADSDPDLPGLDETTQVSITGGVTDTRTATDDIPRITGGVVATDAGPSDLPTLTGVYDTSSLPDGTVFIAVGAILGALGAAVLIWRGIVACLLHRSVERAAVAQHAANDKAAFPAPPAPFYKYSDQESKLSLSGTRRTNRGPIPSSTPSTTNLFFSPTAPGGAGGHQSRNSSAFLPNGFYPAGGSISPQPGNGHQHSISLTNLRPSSRGNINSMVGPSPPDSPSFGPSRTNPAMRNMSTSSLNRPPSQRAPSAYLEDLLDENPQSPPPHGGHNASLMPTQSPHHHGQGRT